MVSKVLYTIHPIWTFIDRNCSSLDYFKMSLFDHRSNHNNFDESSIVRSSQVEHMTSSVVWLKNLFPEGLNICQRFQLLTFSFYLSNIVSFGQHVRKGNSEIHLSNNTVQPILGNSMTFSNQKRDIRPHILGLHWCILWKGCAQTTQEIGIKDAS